jgi:LPXTG-motif cell wall-anchored protein
MKHLALLAAIYVLIAALVLPSSILAQEEADPATETTAAEPAPPEQAPAEPAPAQAAPAEPAPAEPAPAEPAPAPPEPQVLADERDETDSPKPKAIAAASGSVAIADFSFAPTTITINQGDTVTWTNNGPTPHSATADNGSFDTGIFPAGQSRTQTFNEAGSFSYFCTPHPQMRGTVVVQGSQSGGDTPTSSDDSGATGGTGTAAAEADGGPALPNSGADTGALLLLGALMLLLGVAVHRRARAQQPRPAGRIGW